MANAVWLRYQFIRVPMLAVALLVVSCTPATGGVTVGYIADPVDIIAAVAEFGPQIEPVKSAFGTYSFDYLSVQAIGDTFIDLRTQSTFGASLLAGPMAVTVRLTAFAYAGATQVAIGVTPASMQVQMSEKFLMELDRRFMRAEVR